MTDMEQNKSAAELTEIFRFPLDDEEEDDPGKDRNVLTDHVLEDEETDDGMMEAMRTKSVQTSHHCSCQL